MRLELAHPPGRAPERAYAADVLLREFLGLDVALVEEARRDVALGAEGRELRIADVFFSIADEEWLAPATLPRRPLRCWDLRADGVDASVVDARLPCLYARPPLLEERPNGLRLGLDVFGSAFVLLTRYEELALPDRDEHDRFQLTSSLAHREGFLRRPLVDEYVEVLWWALRRVWPRLERRARGFELAPTHDVDFPRCPQTSLRGLALATGFDVARRRDAGLALRRVRAYVRRDNLCDTFDYAMATAERHGLRGAFYFIAGNATGEREAAYSLDEPQLRQLVRRIHERGHEVGLHPSYDTFRDAQRTREELERLRTACAQVGVEQETWGGRQHYLRWANPETWQNWDDAGLDYDSTLGFGGAPGFRCGTCREYPAFNLRTRRPLRLRERPLVAMEVSLLVHARASPERTAEDFRELRETCRRFGGRFTLLWHNNWLISPRQRRAYDAVLA